MLQGVLVGCDQNQEWLLPWWWNHFQRYNSYPVAFADFGMSNQARLWCKERGELISITKKRVPKPKDQNKIASWEKRWEEEGRSGDLWTQRAMWFKKPSAMSQSPFQRTLWLDLDCEIKGDLKSLFSTPLASAKMGAASWETNALFSQTKEIKYPQYNSGVMLFEKGSKVLAYWTQAIENVMACADDEVLSYLVAHLGLEMTRLPAKYNWEILRFGFNPEALIIHWMSDRGKEAIQRKIFLDQLA